MATTKRTVDVELSTSGLDAQGRPARVPLVTDESGNVMTMAAPPRIEPELTGEHMLINIGPQHPATHGVLRLVLELDGETVVRCIPHIGYLHCGFEKIGEYRQYNQIIPWTDREDYLNSPGNNVAFALGAERLFGIEITERCKVLRVITCELSRIMSHLVWLGTTCIDRRFHALPVGILSARSDLQAIGGLGGRATHDDDHARRRNGGGRSGWLGRSAQALRPHVPQDAQRDRSRRDAQRHLGWQNDRAGRDVARRSSELRAHRSDAARIGRGV